MNNEEKYRRTALRLNIGNRRAAAANRFPDGARYLVPHACFACRKSFKIVSRPAQATCPGCGGPLHWMGRSFKAPAMRNRKQWAKVQALHEAGFRFSSYRSHDCSPLPSRLADVKQFIRDHPRHPFRVRER